MKIKKRTLKIIVIIILLVAIGYFGYFHTAKDPYQLKGDKLYYSANRGSPEYQMGLMNSTSSYDIYSINFTSRSFLENPTVIHSLFFLPKGKENVPALVLLPGGGVRKESEAKLASKIAEWGYAVLTFDQRGIGETAGAYLGFEQDYQIFVEGKEPIQHLSVYDSLRAYDVLTKINQVDKNNIAIAGESMGGRYAIIAGAIEKRFKGVIGISTSGFHVQKENKPENSYLMSIDPDNYVKDISPRPIFMLHGTNDTTISINDAKYTFNLALDPKDFFSADGCGHGYCNEMNDALKTSLQLIFR